MLIAAGLFILLGIIAVAVGAKAVGIFFIIFGITFVMLVIPKNTLKGLLLLAGAGIAIVSVIVTLFSIFWAVILFAIACVLCFLSWLIGPMKIYFTNK